MKHLKLFLAGIISLIVLVQISCSSSKTAVDEEKVAQVKEQIESRNYRISVDYMFPTRGASRSLTSIYSLTVRGDTLISYLPYFGIAYNIPYGGGNGLNFIAPLFDYSLSFNSKGTASISFRVRLDGMYSCIILKYLTTEKRVFVSLQITAKEFLFTALKTGRRGMIVFCFCHNFFLTELPTIINYSRNTDNTDNTDYTDYNMYLNSPTMNYYSKLMIPSLVYW